MALTRVIRCAFSFALLSLPWCVSAAAPEDRARTQVALLNGKWQINGQVTYPRAKAEGLLMNVRMVNATFEDRHKPEFDPNLNTKKFMDRLPDYAAHGVRAFTFCLQGGMPGYEGAINSAFASDGSLREPYLRRVRRVIEACDQHGLAVILGCFYQRQDQILRDEAAVRNAVVNTVDWLQRSGFKNVLLEIANEFDHDGFDHRVLKTAEGQVELIALAKQHAPRLLVSTSGLGHGRMDERVAQAADFILIHFNGTPLEEIPGRITALKKFGKPIVVNEDDKSGRAGARAAELCVENGASWGLMLKEINQYVPFKFNGAADDLEVYASLQQLTSLTAGRLSNAAGNRSRIQFRHHFIDRELPGDSYGQTSLVDLDKDGDLDFITGGKDKQKTIYWFEFQSPDQWVRHVLGANHPSDVGGTAIDVDADGWVDHIAGGVWYRNTSHPRKEPFERIVFDKDLNAVHDLVAADLDRDGRSDIITMSDRNNLRWYRIPRDPRLGWERHDIGPGVHAGIGVGDIDGDGDLDVARSNAWFENLNGDGLKWAQHPVPFGKPAEPYPLATRCVIADINGDGRNDLVMTENEIRAGKIAWLERLPGQGVEWKLRELPANDDAPRGAYHSLAVADFDRDGDLDIFTVEMER